MEKFWDFAQLVAILLTILVGLFLVLSSFSKNPEKIMGSLGRGFAWMMAILMLSMSVCGLVYVASPLDVSPDVIPVVGQLDDALATAISGCTGTAGLISLAALGISSARRRKAQLPPPKDNEKKLLND